jgi:hypothetical protein
MKSKAYRVQFRAKSKYLMHAFRNHRRRIITHHPSSEVAVVVKKQGPSGSVSGQIKVPHACFSQPSPQSHHKSSIKQRQPLS